MKIKANFKFRSVTIKNPKFRLFDNLLSPLQTWPDFQGIETRGGEWGQVIIITSKEIQYTDIKRGYKKLVGMQQIKISPKRL